MDVCTGFVTVVHAYGEQDKIFSLGGLFLNKCDKK